MPAPTALLASLELVSIALAIGCHPAVRTDARATADDRESMQCGPGCGLREESVWIAWQPATWPDTPLVGAVYIDDRWLIARRELAAPRGDVVLLAAFDDGAFGETVASSALAAGETPLAILAAVDGGAPWLIVQRPAPTARVLVDRVRVEARRFDGSGRAIDVAVLPANDAARVIASDWRADPEPHGVVAWHGGTYRPITEEEHAEYVRLEQRALDPIPAPIHLEQGWMAFTVGPSASGGFTPVRVDVAADPPDLARVRVAATTSGAVAFSANIDAASTEPGVPAAARHARWLDPHGAVLRSVDDAFPDHMLPDAIAADGAGGAFVVGRFSEPGRPFIEIGLYGLDAAGALTGPARIAIPHVWQTGVATGIECGGVAWFVLPVALDDMTTHLYTFRGTRSGPSALVDRWSRPIAPQYVPVSSWMDVRLACSASEVVVIFRHVDDRGSGVGFVRWPLASPR